MLEANSKMIYGFDKKKNPYKMFTPFNKVFPKFLVAYNQSNDKKKSDIVGLNKIISIRLENWLSEYPIGQIVATYGNIDPRLSTPELINIYIQSLISYNGFYNIKRIKLPNSINIDILNQLFVSESEYHSEPIDNFDFICNIDPEGCTDIDDVISYSEKIDPLDSEIISVYGIHI